MKILYVVHQFLPRHVAGTELYTYNLAKALQHRGHEVGIYTREFTHGEEGLRQQDTRYHGLLVKRVHFDLRKRRVSWIAEFCSDFWNAPLVAHFEEHLEATQPDVVHIQHLRGLSPSFITAAKKRNIPTVVTLHDFWFMCDRITLLTTSSRRCSGPLYGLKCPRCLRSRCNPMLVWGLYPLHAALFLGRTIYLRYLLNQVDLIVAPSNFLRHKFIKHGIPAAKIIFSDYGTNTNSLRPYNTNPNRDKVRFAFVGSVMLHKGIHVLIEAFNQLKTTSAELRIYGDPSYAPSYYARVTAMSTNPATHFMGKLDNSRVPAVLAETDVLVVPSIWYENSPLTIHEAAVAGVPVIASDIGGMAELVHRLQSGVLFRVEDAADLCEKMRHLIANPDALRQLRGRVRQLKTFADNAAEFEGIYNKMCATAGLS